MALKTGVEIPECRLLKLFLNANNTKKYNLIATFCTFNFNIYYDKIKKKRYFILFI